MYLKDKIIKLIESHQEDDYYDFKEAWHDNKAEFLHDILSLANNRTVEDGLLIFGVRDKTFEIIGVENDPNRKTQQNIIDFLNTKAFFGGIRPSVELKTINYLKHELDILIVKNTNDTPYYLADKYSDGKYTIRPNYIYTRIKDTNTPIDKSADINQVEYLWKKRFLLTESPIKRIFNELKYPQNWERKNSIKDNIPFYYNIYHPEFTVEILDDDYSDSNNTEFYSYKQINHSTSFGIIAVKYFNTEVYTTQYICLDGGRYMTITPQWAFPEIEKYKNVDYSYKYFLLDSYDYILKEFLYSESSDYRPAVERFDECVLYFENNSQRLEFENYLIKFKDEIKQEILDGIKKYDYMFVKDNENEDSYIKHKLSNITVYKKYYSKFVINYS